MICVNKSSAISDLFQAGDIVALPALYRLDVLGSFQQTFGRAGVKPSHTATHKLDGQLTALKILIVNTCDLQLAASGRLNRSSYLTNLTIVKIKTRHSIIRLWLLGLLFNSNNTALIVELYNAKGSRVLNRVSEDNRTANGLYFLFSAVKRASKILPMEHVVTENQRARLACKEIPTDGKRLGQTAWFILLRVLKAHAQLSPITKKFAEGCQITRRRNNQNLANARKHEHAQRVVDQWLIVYRQQLLIHSFRDWVKSGPRPASKDNALHFKSLRTMAQNLTRTVKS